MKDYRAIYDQMNKDVEQLRSSRKQLLEQLENVEQELKLVERLRTHFHEEFGPRDEAVPANLAERMAVPTPREDNDGAV